MITIEQLKELGASTDEGLGRCLNNEDFYLRMVGLVLADDGFERLKNAIEAHDLTEAFERAHALKGSVSNVALTQLLAPIEKMTEDLRAGKDIDYSADLDLMFEELEKMRAL